jgi:hypothetical protein
MPAVLLRLKPIHQATAPFLAEQVSAHLAFDGVDRATLTWQTDNGSAFLDN